DSGRQRSIYVPRYQLMLELLREARVERGVTQAQVAELMGCTESQISRWESCRLRMDLRDLDDYCRVLELDLVDFLAQWKTVADSLGPKAAVLGNKPQRRAKPPKKSG